jgi:hypothetical protein
MNENTDRAATEGTAGSADTAIPDSRAQRTRNFLNIFFLL